MRRQWRRYAQCALLLAPVLLAGCHSGNGLTLAPVKGKITFKGEPVKFGTVSFVPDASKGTDGPIAMGPITRDGTYILSTDEAGDGAIVGHHKISVVGLDPAPVAKDRAAKEEDKPPPDPDADLANVMKNRAKALHAGRTPTARKAAASLGDTFSDRGGRVYRYVTPKKLGEPKSSGLEVDVARGSNTVNIDIAEDGTPKIAH
jgi:hypothetical protein